MGGSFEFSSRPPAMEVINNRVSFLAIASVVISIGCIQVEAYIRLIGFGKERQVLQFRIYLPVGWRFVLPVKLQ